MGEYPAALRAAVFSLSSKNLRGAFKRPPNRAPVNARPILSDEKFSEFQVFLHLTTVERSFICISET